MFNKNNFCHIASNNRNEKKAGVFVYKTTDNLATVAASGYFNDKIVDINLHDLIIHEWHDPTDRTKVQKNVLCVTERTLDNVGTVVIKTKWEEDIEQTIEDLQEYVDNTFVRKDGTSVMTGPLLMRATDDFKCAIAPYWDGIGFFKLNDNNSVTLMASLEYEDGLTPATDNTYNLGTATKRWKDARIVRVITAVINNGYDIAVPVTNSPQTFALKSEVDLAANSGRMITAQGVWYAKMYAATVPPAADDDTNYADFSQTDGQGNPIIVTYTRTNGAWVQDQTITPPAEYDGYVPITSKIWDIPEQAGQQGGRVLWNHQSKDFTPYPQIISFEGANITNGSFQGSADLSGTSTVSMPNNPGSTQIVNKDYVDTAISQVSASAKSIDAGIVGSLTISSDGDVSGMDSSNYLTFPGTINLTKSDDYTICIVFTTGATLGGEIFSSRLGSLQPNSIYLGIDHISGDKLYFSAKVGGSTVSITGTTTLQPNTKYTVALQKTADYYTLYLNYQIPTEGTVACSAVPGLNSNEYKICPNSNIATVHMKECYCGVGTINNIKVLEWTGLGEPGLHQRASNRHEIIDFQAPTSSNNYTWYRKYADGWVEQGGQFAQSGSGVSITLPVTMADANYPVVGGTLDNSSTQGWRYANRTTTGFTKNLIGSTNCGGSWQVSGMAA